MVLGPSPDNMAPNYTIKVSGQELEIGVTGLISRVEYEFADGVADMMRVNVNNPQAQISDSKIFALGNEMEVWMGYGSNLEYIGATIINKVRADFPEEGRHPVMDVVGYTKDHQMMDNAPPEAKEGEKKGKKGKGGRTFKESKWSDAVRARAEDYGLAPDVDDTPDAPHDFIQPAGMTDYEFIQGLANLTGYVFWVERDPSGVWFLRFRSPESVNNLQSKKFTFEYDTELATLLSFQPEMNFSGSYTKLVAHVKNARTGKLLKVEVEDGKAGPDTNFRGEPKDKILEPPPSGSGVKLFLGEFSVNVATTKRFETEEQLAIWAEAWFKRNRNNFILARGKTIGIETLRARSIHEVKGVGTVYSGEYQLDRVKHIMDAESGYELDFHGRRVLPEP